MTKNDTCVTRYISMLTLINPRRGSVVAGIGDPGRHRVVDVHIQARRHRRCRLQHWCTNICAARTSIDRFADQFITTDCTFNDIRSWSQLTLRAIHVVKNGDAAHQRHGWAIGRYVVCYSMCISFCVTTGAIHASSSAEKECTWSSNT